MSDSPKPPGSPEPSDESDLASVDAEIAGRKDWSADHVRYEAINSIRKRLPKQEDSKKLIDELHKSLKCKETEAQAIQVNALLLSVLYALHSCDPNATEDVLPTDPCIGDHLADAVNDTLLLSVFVIVLFSAPDHWRTRIDPLPTAGAVGLKIHAPCPDGLREYLAPLQDAKITVASALGSAEMHITIPLQ